MDKAQGVRKETFLKNSMIVFGSRIVIILLNLARSVVAARALGPTGKGIVALAFLVPSLATLLAKLDISMANVYFIGRRRFEPKRIVANSILFALLNGFLFVVLLFLFAPWLTSALLRDLDPPILLYVAALTIPCSLLSSYLSSILRGLREFTSHSLVGMAMPTVVVVLLLTASFLSELTPMQVVAIRLSAIVTQIIVLLLWLARRGVLQFTLRFDRTWLQEATHYSLRNYVGSLSQYLNQRLDMYLVAFWLNPTEIGYYSLAVGLAQHLSHVPAAISIVLLSNVASSEAREANRFTPVVARITLAIVGVWAVVFWLLLDILVPLVYTDKFEPSITPLRFLLPGVIPLTLWAILTDDLAGRGKPEYRSVSASVALAFTLVLDILLIPLFGITGAAAASTLAYVVAAVVSFSLYRQTTGARLSDVLLIRPADARLLYRAALALGCQLSRRATGIPRV